MRTHHLIPFETAVKEAHLMSLMVGYNSVDGVPSHINHWLLTDVLRGEWGFQGFVYSDWQGIDFLTGHRVVQSNQDAARQAMSAGVDMEAPSLNYYNNLPALVSSGQLSSEVVSQSTARVLRPKFIAGLFDNARTDGDPALVQQVAHTPAHIATALSLAQEGIVLLKNTNNLLPLNVANLNSIAVIGPNAAQIEFGDYSWTKANAHGVNFYQALTNRFTGTVRYAKGCGISDTSTTGFADAVAAASQSDVAVVVIGDTSLLYSSVPWEDSSLPANGTCGEGFDVANPVPPGVQQQLVEAVAATGKPTIVILLNSRPYCLPWMHDNIPAIIEAFSPGEQQGNALVDILFGTVNPSGHLPVTLARSAGHLPCTYDFKGYGRGFYHQPNVRDYVDSSPAPLWPFGFGLSYTTFSYSNLQIQTPTVPAANGVLQFSCTVQNTGSRSGKAVPQIYWRQGYGNIAPPEKRLLRFAKVDLSPGQSTNLTFSVPVAELRSLTLNKTWTILPGSNTLQLGDSAETIHQTATFTITQ